MTFDSVDYEKGETPMTDYQFRQYETLRDERDVLVKKLDAIYSAVKSKVSAGASPEEILSAVADLKNS